MWKHILFIALIPLPLTLSALPIYSEETEVATSTTTTLLPEVDETLFNLYTPSKDPYAEATKYYSSPMSQRRRGLDWWIAKILLRPITPMSRGLEVAEPTRRMRLFASTKDYNIGVAGLYTSTLRSGWNISAEATFKSGNDLSVEGLFSQDLRAEVGVSRRFSRGHHLSILLTAPTLCRALQSSASQEAITLTGNYLYNPSWGLYDCEVRNSRVLKYAIPELTTHYQRPLYGSTTLTATLASSFGRRSVSRLGWYDAYNPSPDYYRKLPSYASSTSSSLVIEQLWRDNDTSYTQIDWDKLVRYNQLSSDGSAHYLLEDQVEQRRHIELSPTLISRANERVELSYGLTLSLHNERHFKEIADLLGAEYHLDHDLFIGDNVHLGNNMQNDLRNPDREVKTGERFGYDYTSRHTMWAMSCGVEYRSRALALIFRGYFGEEQMRRIGNYEKERFPGSLSYGASTTIRLPNNDALLNLSYTLSNRHNLTLCGRYIQRPNDDDDTFIQIQDANRIVDTPTSRRVGSVNIAYRFDCDKLSLDADAYLIYSRNESQVWSSYDDLSYTYTNNVTSGIGSRSIGIDIVANYEISRELEWSVALALGDYTYDVAPIVTLYDHSDMSQLASSPASGIEGCKVGNAPQFIATSSLTYLPQYEWIISLNMSYGAGRYAAPSTTRRSDRLVLAASYSPELARSIIEQQRLPSLFDATLNVTKMIYLSNNRRLAATLRINNLLGERDRIDYGRESNRVLTTAAGSSVGSQYLEPNEYIYSSPRSLYLSCSFTF